MMLALEASYIRLRKFVMVLEKTQLVAGPSHTLIQTFFVVY